MGDQEISEDLHSDEQSEDDIQTSGPAAKKSKVHHIGDSFKHSDGESKPRKICRKA